eukprot:6922206-Prymnesium_polylepis.3
MRVIASRGFRGTSLRVSMWRATCKVHVLIQCEMSLVEMVGQVSPSRVYARRERISSSAASSPNAVRFDRSSAKAPGQDHLLPVLWGVVCSPQ